MQIMARDGTEGWRNTAVSRDTSGVDIESLLRVPLLATLPRSRVERLASELPAQDVPVGQVVARAGDPAHYLVVIETGSVTAVHDTANGTRVRLSAVTGPRVIDKAATLDGGVHTANWTATTPCRLRLLPADLFRQLIGEEPALRQQVLGYLSAEVNRHRRARVRHAAPGPLAQVAAWLAEASRTNGDTVYLAGGQQGLGEEIGLSRVTVNRALHALVAVGAVRVQPRMVTVLDAERLTIACADPKGATQPT
jgi:CRP/FNR family transcriptional regulator, cyclic AMP receptor protein